jgi:membrane protease YdiL (CAAX protease family)
MIPPIPIVKTPTVKFWDIFLVFIGALAIQVTVYLLAKSFSLSPFQLLMLAAGVNDLCWIGGYQALSESRGWRSLKQRFAPVDTKVMLLSVAGAAVPILFITGLAATLEWLGINITGTLDRGVDAGDLRQFPLAILLIAIIGPAAEELMFRGLLLDWLRQKISPWPAMVLISLLFASVHSHSFGNGIAGVLALLDRFLIGMAASILVLRYQSLRPAFVLHATNNTVAAAVLMLMP